jgi:hypothetical protein
VTGSRTVSFVSPQSRTEFEFKQDGSNGFTAKGDSLGRTQFKVGAIASNFASYDASASSTTNNFYYGNSSYSYGAGANTSNNTGFYSSQNQQFAINLNNNVNIDNYYSSWRRQLQRQLRR